MIYLYVKSHNVTGLKYFGKTTQSNPNKYQGSGKYWKRHIRKYGYDVTTEIVGEFEDLMEASEFALNFSNDNNIVESSNWANLKRENGLDGSPPGVKFSDEHRNNIRESRLGKCFNDFDETTRQRMSAAAKMRADADVKNGKSLFAGESGSALASRRNAILVKEGRHNFLGGEVARETNRKRIVDGTHQSLGKLLCVDKEGNTVYVDVSIYHEQRKPVEDREYVHVSSNEAKKRKLTALKGI